MSRSIATEDRISSLPDPILHHILSFLPTKLAATTSILSKRWNPLWLSVVTLQFDDTPFKGLFSFLHFISSVFLSRDITIPIRSFYLKCSKRSDKQDINRFVYAAVQTGGIENLNLYLFSKLALKVKVLASIFSCKTLVNLHLRKVKVNDLSNVVVDLPRLKTLHLSNVSFRSVEYLTKFLSRCLILEELHLKSILIDTEEEEEEHFLVLPNLIRANIDNAVDVFLFTLCCKAEVLQAKLDMKYLNTTYHEFPMCHNLIYMELILENNHSEKWKWLLEVLNHCPKLQNLTIHEDSQYEVVDNWIDPTIVPECLSTQLRTCLLKG